MAPVYPPGVLQKTTIPDPTTKGGYLEITHFPVPMDEDFDIEEFAPRDEQLAEILRAAEEAHFTELDRKIRIIGEALEGEKCAARRDSKWYQRTDSWTRTLPATEDEKEWPEHRVWAHFMLWPLEMTELGGEIEEVLVAAEQDRDYEEWINSKEYQKSLKDYNLHKLLAWDKFSEDNSQHPKWSGQGTESDGEINGVHYYLGEALLKERYKVEVYVDTLCWGKNYYAKGTTPYGDVYIPNKIAEWLKDFCGLYEMEIALQDVKGAPGKGPNSFRWTCVYLHNNGHSLE